MSARRSLLPAVLAAALLIAPPAFAKQVQRIKACGSGGDCRTVDARGDDAMGLISEGGGPPDHRAPYYRLTLVLGESPTHIEGSVHALYSPSIRMVTLDEPGASIEWAPVPPAAARVADRAVHGLPPLPASRMPVERFPQARMAPDRPAQPGPAPASEGGGVPWAALAGGVLAALAAAALAVRTVARRRGGPQPSA
jgi:hypothetical protein